MKHRIFVILALILLIAIVFIQVVLAAPGDNNSTSSIYQVELFELRKRGPCDSTKYTITNIDSFPITTNHYFTTKGGPEVFSFNSHIDIGETKTYDLHNMDEMPLYVPVNVSVTSIGEITGTILDFPPCDISIECSLEFPFIGKINTPYTCTATVTPEEALLPITITWVEWLPEQQDWHIIGIGETVELSWTMGGWNQVYVFAKNSVGSVSSRFFIYVNSIPKIYIPISIK